MYRQFCKMLAFLLLFALFSSSVRADNVPRITAQAWLIADSEGNILDGTHIHDKRSIASITKLMTVMVIMDSKQNLDEHIPKKLYNRIMTRQELIDLALVKSDNQAAKILCDLYPTGYQNCIDAMNDKAHELEMFDTHFIDSIGISNDNTSTASDLIKLVMAASTYPVIVSASSKNTVKYQINKSKLLQFYNTNTLIGKGHNFIVSKTGFIRRAGGCIVFMIETVRGIRTVVLLGSRDTKTRIPEAFLISTLY